METTTGTTTEIAVVTVPAFSHQASILEFCKRLLLLHQNHHFHVTCFIPTLGSPPPPSIALVQSLPSSISCTFLPPVNLDDQPEGLGLEIQLQLAVSRSMPLVREALKSWSLGSSCSSLAALVAEPLSIEALEIAKELKILSYLYFPCSAMMLSLCFYSSKLNREVSCEFRDLPEAVEIPGCVPMSGKDLPDNLQDRSCQAYSQFLQRCQLYHLAEGILVNSFAEMEADAIRAWQAEEELEDGTKGRSGNYPSVYAIGPIIRTGSASGTTGSDRDPEKCLGWLEKQPPNSVLFVSFGSGGRVSQAQLNELALGLDLSSQRFLWVNVRSPSDKASASYLSDENEDPLLFLPPGFLERTKGRGLVMPSWAPQVQVLGHSSTGGFLSHCGWNSILESIVQGVPLIAWPLFAEQRTNAAMLADGLKVAIRPRVGESGIVEKAEIARVIKCVMEGGGEEEGEEIRRRMKELRDAAACALMEDGSSTKTLCNLALKWRKLGGK